MLRVRNATAKDMYFVRSSFYTSYWKKFAGKYMQREVYKAFMDGHVNRLLSKSVTLVAFFEEAPDEILGWSMQTGATLHWAYVKGYARRQGIATGLVLGRASVYSHMTDAAGRQFAQSVNMQFNPLFQGRE